MDNRPYVLLIAAAPLAVGGLEKHLLTLAAGLKDEFRFALAGDLHEPFKSQWEGLGFPVFEIKAKGKFDLKTLRQLRQLILREKPGLIHIQDSRAGILARLAKIGSGVPTVYSVHYPAYQYFDISPLGRAINRQVERAFNWLLTDRVAFPFRDTYYQAVKRRIVRKGQAHLIPTGVDVAAFKRASEAIGTREKTCQGNGEEVCRLMVVARLSAEKNVSLALKTTAELVRKGYPAALLVVGDGPLRADLEAEAKALGIAGDVQFLGYRQDIPQMLAQADIIFLTSKFEGGPTVLLEEMAAGRPVVAVPVGDAPWLLPGGAGIVVEEHSAEKLASAAAELIEDEPKRKMMGEHAQRVALEEFTLEKMYDGYRRLYMDVMGGER